MKSESEEEEIEDEDECDFDMDNPDTSKRNRYKPIATNPEDELNFHTDAEIHTGENKNEKLITENTSIRRSDRESRQPYRYGRHYIQKTFGHNKYGLWKYVSGFNGGQRNLPSVTTNARVVLS